MGSGDPNPAAEVADNDLAVGRIVDAISRSQFWKSSAIFVVEGDAPNGVDHVDGHRGTASQAAASTADGSAKTVIPASMMGICLRWAWAVGPSHGRLPGC